MVSIERIGDAQKENKKTICSYCSIGCGILVDVDVKGGISVEGDLDYPSNKGIFCSKGRNLNYVTQDTSDRILHPETGHQCRSCFMGYDKLFGDTKAAIAEGTLFKDLPEDYVCPVCDYPKSHFEKTVFEYS